MYGEELRALLAFYPDAEVSDEQVIVQCEHCYRYEGRPLLAAYIRVITITAAAAATGCGPFMKISVLRGFPARAAAEQ